MRNGEVDFSSVEKHKKSNEGTRSFNYGTGYSEVR